MKLIDADVLIEQMDAEPEGGYYSPHDVISLLMIQPVVEERKTGKWIETDSHEPCWFKCDQCGRLSDIKEIYCPTCGASMANTTCGADMRDLHDRLQDAIDDGEITEAEAVRIMDLRGGKDDRERGERESGADRETL